MGKGKEKAKAQGSNALDNAKSSKAKLQDTTKDDFNWAFLQYANTQSDSHLNQTYIILPELGHYQLRYGNLRLFITNANNHQMKFAVRYIDAYLGHAIYKYHSSSRKEYLRSGVVWKVAWSDHWDTKFNTEGSIKFDGCDE